MKKIFIFTAIFASMYFISCGSSKQATYSTPAPTQPTQTSYNQFEETYSDLITRYTTDEEAFGAVGFAYGLHHQKGHLQINAHQNAKDIIYAEMSHAFKGASKTYRNTVGNNMGTDLENKLEEAGLAVIKTMVNDVKNSSGPRFSRPDEKGNIECCYGIRIAKKEYREKFAEYISDNEELKIRAKEEKFDIDKFIENF